MKCHIINHTNNNDYKEYYSDLRKYFRKTFKYLGLDQDYEMSVILCDDDEIQMINHQYRNIDKPTDVISFALLDNADEFDLELETIYLGDIFINLNRVASQAKAYEHSEKREFCFLFVHGLLHCLGYDHMEKDDEEIMFGLQKEILGSLK